MVAVPGVELLQSYAELLQRLAVLVALVVGFGVALALDERDWVGRLRGRLLLGVPWGTLVVAGFVLAVYLFLQGGLDNWYRPVTIPFRAWSYFYPLGILTGAFSHSSASHLLGNLVGTLTLAPLVEYAWGHFPRERGSHSFGSLRENPYVRAFVVFPAVTLVVGLLTAVFAIGPIIGFSGVVFAFAGFALVYYPIGTVVALSVGDVVSLLYSALSNPELVARARPVFVTPWWAQIAIQGHAIGLLFGVLLGVLVVRRRDDPRPGAFRLWAGVLLFAVVQSLWAVYWFRGASQFVLFRWLGVILVVGLAVVVTVALRASDRPLFGRYAARFDPETVRGFVPTLPRWEVAVAVLVFSAAALSGPAVPVNLTTASDEPLPNDPVTVRDYEVTYAEDVPDGMVSAVDVEAFGETTQVNTSGVLVRSESRGIWTTAVSTSRLAFEGETRVRVGGVGWRESVLVNRTGWSAVGGGTAYQVRLTPPDAEQRLVYRSSARQVEGRIGGANVSVVPATDGFRLNVTRGNTTRSVPLPGQNETTATADLVFTRDGPKVFAVADDTRVRIATRETYRGQR
jgi:membrane associated rhomboid family serine protease